MAVEKYYGTGRRKSSVARVYLMPGKEISQSTREVSMNTSV